jgi:hypothetical protein
MKIAHNSDGAPFHDFPQFDDPRTQAALELSKEFRLLSQLQLSKQELLDEENKTRAKLHQDLKNISSDITASINLIEENAFGSFLPEKEAKNSFQNNLEKTLSRDTYELHISVVEYRCFAAGRTAPTIRLRDVVNEDTYEISFKRILKNPQSFGLDIRFNHSPLIKAQDSPSSLLDSSDREHRFSLLIHLRDLLQEFLDV